MDHPVVRENSPHFVVVIRQTEREWNDGLLVERGDHELPRLLHDCAGVRRLRVNHGHLDIGKVKSGPSTTISSTACTGPIGRVVKELVQ